jgi:hypothetical protein
VSALFKTRRTKSEIAWWKDKWPGGGKKYLEIQHFSRVCLPRGHVQEKKKTESSEVETR